MVNKTNTSGGRLFNGRKRCNQPTVAVAAMVAFINLPTVALAMLALQLLQPKRTSQWRLCFLAAAMWQRNATQKAAGSF